VIRGSPWESPNALLVSRDYEGKHSKRGWGLNLSTNNLPLLVNFRFERMVASQMQTGAETGAEAD
jgi:hypothetical protein